MRRTLISVAITALVASSPLNVAFAAELEEVLVTATKRGEFNVQDLAEAVYAVDSSSLRAKNQLDFEDHYDRQVRNELCAFFDDHRAWPEPNLFFGGVHAARRDAAGTLTGHGDARRDGVSIVVST